MAVIPGRAVLVRDKFVGLLVAGRERALGDAIGAILSVCEVLTHAMPMNTRAVVPGTQVVVYCDLNGITPVRLDRWAGVLAVHKKHRLLVTVKGRLRASHTTSLLGDVEVIVHRFARVGPALVIVTSNIPTPAPAVAGVRAILAIATV